MFKYGGQVERIGHKSLYYTVLEQKTKKRSCCDDISFLFSFVYNYLYVIVKPRRKKNIHRPKFCTKLLCSTCITQKHEHSINSSVFWGFFLGVTSTWVIVSLRTNLSNVL